MTELVDSQGRPLQPSQAAALCPACSAPAKHLEMSHGFGGYWSKACTRCGHVLASGRGDAPPETRA